MDFNDLECYHVLYWLSETIKPKTYMEIGVREGASLACVLAREPEIVDFVMSCLQDDRLSNNAEITQRISGGFTLKDCKPLCFLFDNWSADGLEQGELRLHRLMDKGFNHRSYHLYSGDSKATVPDFFKQPTSPNMIDLIFVDGDHTPEGVSADLENVHGHFKVLVVHDLLHPQYPQMMDLYKDYCRRYRLPNFIVGRNTMATGVVFAL